MRAKNRVIIEDVAPGMILFKPDHRTGVVAAVSDYLYTNGRRKPRKSRERCPVRPGKVSDKVPTFLGGVFE